MVARRAREREDALVLHAVLLDVLERLPERSDSHDPPAVQMRIGIHCGSVVAGVIGTHKPAYDIWGDTVNTASRMESHGVSGRVHVDHSTYLALRTRYRFEPRGTIEVKGLGPMTTYFLLGPR